MAIPSLKPASVSTLFSAMVTAGFMQLFMVVMAIAERCTRAVPVQEYQAKKVHVLRRVPAACSNWDKAWSWLTKVDCGTKYRLDYVTVPNREVRQYKLQYVCCDGDNDCKEADNIQTSGFDTTDERFLAIVLGSTAACVVIIIIILAITFYTKKKRCHIICDQENHVYASADGDESQDGNGDNLKCQPEDIESETDQKGCEVEYAEINDPRLPRYTDIFKDNMEVKENPFNNASAPPMYSVATAKSYVNSCGKMLPSFPASEIDEIQVIPAESSSLNLADGDASEKTGQARGPPGQVVDPDDDPDTLYFNVREKKRRKKRNSSQSGSASSSKGDVRVERDSNPSGANPRGGSKKGRTTSVTVEMMVKSSSASETIGKNSEALAVKQKRRSAPPDTIGAPSTFVHRYPASTSTVPRSPSLSSCSVIDESAGESRNVSDKYPKAASSRYNPQQRPSSKSGRGSTSDGSNTGSTRPRPKDINAAHSANIAELSSESISPSKDIMITCRNAVNSRLECEPSQPGEKDSLLRTPSCHSGCGSDPNSEGCEHCSKYDRLNYLSDADVESLHIYQCLEDVRREVQELWPASSSTCSGVLPPTKSDGQRRSSISRQGDHVQVLDNNLEKNTHERI